MMSGDGDFEPPIITGETTVTEGSTLQLDCNASNSVPQPTVQWVGLAGVVIRDGGDLEIRNISRNMTGTYTCVATQTTTNATMNSTASVVVQCKHSINCNTYSYRKYFASRHHNHKHV